MKKLFLLFAMAAAFSLSAKQVSVTWSLSDPAAPEQSAIAGDDAAAALITPGYANGSCISKIERVTKSGAASGYEAVEYDPPFATYYVTTAKTSATAGHCFSVTVTPQTGHKFKPVKLSLDAFKGGTDKGNFDVTLTNGSASATTVASGVSVLRNKVDNGNPDACSHHEFLINDVVADGVPVTFTIYIYNINGVDVSSPKCLGFRNIIIEGAVDEEIYDASHYITSFGCTVDDGSTANLLPLISALKDGEMAAYGTRLTAEPKDFAVTCAPGYTAEVEYASRLATVTVYEDGTRAFEASVRFSVRPTIVKPEAKPLGRGLMSLSLSGAKMGTGNLVSWRHRASDDQGVKYKLYRCSATDPVGVALNDGLYITDRTNWQDASGDVSAIYRLETYDRYGQKLEDVTGGATWESQTMSIPVEAPVDTRFGALYNPNDAAFCDMDGDGEYEIVLKWSPGNEKDAARTGDTSNPVFDCYRLDGTRLWRIDLGQNFFTSAHTIQFIAWDFDGDGYGEFMCKTGPGTIDGQGNYVLLGTDDPTANWLNSRGKQVSGPEYITVFDGMTGAELSTIPYHTDYQAGEAYWGDTEQNRSERYLAALAYLDGEDANPSPIFVRGYYSGSFVAAYDWDGNELKERWVSRNTTSGKGLWGEGAHWVSVGDCDNDGRQEIVIGSAALDHDGTLLYRTGLGHGDALHLGDLLTERDGLEVLMVHEKAPYGYDLRDAATGELIRHETAGEDTGRGLAAHFDSSEPSSQIIYSATTAMLNLDDNSVNAETWAIGSSGAGINNRIYWDGDLYDEFFDKNVLGHWNPENKAFDRYKVNNTYYTIGTLNNSTKYNPCVLGDLLGDWREEIVAHDGSFDRSTGAITAVATHLIINATSYPSDYRLPHLMDDAQYRVQVVNQNVCYNQPPHLSFDPAVVYAGNPNQAQQEDEETTGVSSVTIGSEAPAAIYNMQGMRLQRIAAPGCYIIDGRKVMMK